jgi:hypothetical protein
MCWYLLPDVLIWQCHRRKHPLSYHVLQPILNVYGEFQKNYYGSMHHSCRTLECVLQQTEAYLAHLRVDPDVVHSSTKFGLQHASKGIALWYWPYACWRVRITAVQLSRKDYMHGT